MILKKNITVKMAQVWRKGGTQTWEAVEGCRGRQLEATGLSRGWSGCGGSER